MARRVEARIGQRVPGKVEVLEGMAVGDVVVVAGQSRLGGGPSVPVRVIDLSRPAGDRNGAPKPGAAASSGIARTNASVL